MSIKAEEGWKRLAALGVKQEIPTPEGEARMSAVTLTITTDHGSGITTQAAFHVIDKDHREYNVTAKDGDGKIYLDIHGTVMQKVAGR